MNSSWEKFDDALAQLWDFFVPPMISFALVIMIYYNLFNWIVTEFKEFFNKSSVSSESLDQSLTIVDLFYLTFSNAEGEQSAINFDKLIDFVSTILVDTSSMIFIFALIIIFISDRIIRSVAMLSMIRIKSDNSIMIERAISKSVQESVNQTLKSPVSDLSLLRETIVSLLDSYENLDAFKLRRRELLERMKRGQLLFSYCISFLIITISVIFLDSIITPEDSTKIIGLHYEVAFLVFMAIAALISISLYIFDRSLNKLIRLEFMTYANLKRHQSDAIFQEYGETENVSGVYVQLWGYNIFRYQYLKDLRAKLIATIRSSHPSSVPK